MPKSGWECVGSDDLGDLNGNCELCGTQLRYLYLVQHPNWPAMEIGTDCCDKLTGSSEASEHLDTHKKRTDKLKRVVASPRWRRHSAGGIWIKQKGIAVRIVKRADSYKIRMERAEGKGNYPTLLDAQIKVFESIESGEAPQYLKKQKANGTPLHS